MNNESGPVFAAYQIFAMNAMNFINTFNEGRTKGLQLTEAQLCAIDDGCQFLSEIFKFEALQVTMAREQSEIFKEKRKNE